MTRDWLDPFVHNKIVFGRGKTLHTEIISLFSFLTSQDYTVYYSKYSADGLMPKYIVYASAFDLFMWYVCHNQIDYEDCARLLIVCYVIVVKHYEENKYGVVSYKSMVSHKYMQKEKRKLEIQKCVTLEMKVLKFFDYNIHRDGQNTIGAMHDVGDISNETVDFINQINWTFFMHPITLKLSPSMRLTAALKISVHQMSIIRGYHLRIQDQMLLKETKSLYSCIMEEPPKKKHKICSTQ